MTSENSRVADQLRRSYYGDAWHGPSLSELLAGVTETQALARPIASAHCIWEIVLHITLWERLPLNAMRGGSLPEEGDDWPKLAGSWETALSDLRTATDELAAAIEAFPTARLEDTVPGRKYPFAHLIHGVVQHNLYHAGQIAILKK
jgi:uncharacterized damage-inducible protein DinB